MVDGKHSRIWLRAGQREKYRIDLQSTRIQLMTIALIQEREQSHGAGW